MMQQYEANSYLFGGNAYVLGGERNAGRADLFRYSAPPAIRLNSVSGRRKAA